MVNYTRPVENMCAAYYVLVSVCFNIVMVAIVCVQLTMYLKYERASTYIVEVPGIVSYCQNWDYIKFPQLFVDLTDGRVVLGRAMERGS